MTETVYTGQELVQPVVQQEVQRLGKRGSHMPQRAAAERLAASGGDANSSTGVPLFVDDANGDLHLDPNDTLAQGAGVDISGIIDYGLDGDTRDSSTKTAGADVPD